VILLALLLAASPDAGLLARPIEVSADKLELLNKEGRAIYTGHAKAIRDTTTVTCDTLTVFYAAGREVSRIEAVGHVVAVDGDRTATGERANYDNLTGILVVDGNPQAQLGTRTVKGEKVTFITGLDKVEITKARTVAPNESSAQGSTVEIDADKLVLEDKKSIAVWTGNVRARRGPTLIKAPELTAHYDERGTVTRVQARGGVEATDADKWARGQRADYDNARGVLVVTGKPEARQGPNRMRGTKITFITGKDTLEVENATTILQADKKKKP
jgi:lipopolysaccharide transport protein LptA